MLFEDTKFVGICYGGCQELIRDAGYFPAIPHVVSCFLGNLLLTNSYITVKAPPKHDHLQPGSLWHCRLAPCHTGSCAVCLWHCG